MLTRLYIDNFRCFVNFEYRPARKQLILGRNGSGKSSLLDALLFLRQFAVNDDRTEDLSILNERTRWMAQPHQTFELESALDGDTFIYRLVLEPWGEPPRPRVRSQVVRCNGEPIFEFNEGEVTLYDDRQHQKVKYPFDWHRSALATIVPRGDTQTLTRFMRWFGGLVCFRLNPFAMGPRAEGENEYPRVDLSNIAAWYRHLVQANPKHMLALFKSLEAVIDAFEFLSFKPFGEKVSLLVAEFERGVTFGFGELSEGQRCLICLYTILHFVLAKGSTVILDEPDNFVSLREIQPWLTGVTDAVEDGHGQILVISHHPELINQWATQGGVQFVRDGIGPVRVEEFRGDRESSLSPAELVARGWERG